MTDKPNDQGQHQGQHQGGQPPQGQQRDADHRQQEADQAAAERKRRTDDATKHMTDRRLEDRVRAAHPHAADSDQAHQQMLADYDRLAKEQQEHHQHQEQPRAEPRQG